MRRRFITGLLVGALGIGCLLVRVSVSRAAPDLDIYAGESVLIVGIELGGWGSGLAVEDQRYALSGDRSIRVETNGYYAGARLMFDEPIDMTEQALDPYALMEFLIRFKEGPPPRTRTTSNNSGTSGAPGITGFPSGLGGSALPGSGSGAPGFPGAPGGVPGYQGLSAGQGTSGPRPPATKRLKIILIGVEGTVTATNHPIVLFPAREENWYHVAVPFSSFKGLEEMDTFQLKEMRIFGDHKDEFWIGEIRTTTDEEPITVEPLSAQEVSVGDRVQFRAEATAGLSALKFSWDFNAADGIQEDATGQTAVHYYRKASGELVGSLEPEPYVVTLTVTDLSGVKQTERRTVDVIVNR